MNGYFSESISSITLNQEQINLPIFALHLSAHNHKYHQYFCFVPFNLLMFISINTKFYLKILWYSAVFCINLLVYCFKYLIQHYLLLFRSSKNDFEPIKMYLNAAHIWIYLIGKWNILIVPWAFLNYFAYSHIKLSNCIILFFLLTFFLSIKLVIYDPLCLISASCPILLWC